MTYYFQGQLQTSFEGDGGTQAQHEHVSKMHDQVGSQHGLSVSQTGNNSFLQLSVSR